MKKIIILLILISINSHAQWYAFKKKNYESITNFKKDENGKIIFYGVIANDSLPSRDTLWQNAKVWLKSILNEKGDKITDEQYLYGTVEASVSYMVYIESMVSKYPHGKISYKVAIDVKEKKYRYTFSDFVFLEYQQDKKDMKYYPVAGRYKGMEIEKFGGHQGAWESHRFNLKKKIEAQELNLKAEIKKFTKKVASNPIKSDSILKEEPVIKTKNW